MRTHCRQGHEFTEATLYVDSEGSRRCRLCEREKSNRYFRTPHRKDQKKKSDRVKSLRKKYGMSTAEYQKIFNEQKGRCEICRCEVTAQRYGVFKVDHDHKTGKVRGLLCHHCNFGIGMFKDNPELCRSAIDYLVKA